MTCVEPLADVVSHSRRLRGKRSVVASLSFSNWPSVGFSPSFPDSERRSTTSKPQAMHGAAQLPHLSQSLTDTSAEWGILIMYFIGYGCTFIEGPASFRTAWGIQFVPCFFLIIGLPFLPRSPRWLAKMDRTSEAIEILANIHAKGDKNDPLVVAEWEEITEVLTLERTSGKGWRKFVENGMWKRTLAGFTVQMWQQNSGANVMTYVSRPQNTSCRKC